MMNPNDDEMAANPPNPLPEELMIEIFSRLPTKSVGRFRCLSKFWGSELSNSQFLDLHFTRKPHQENLILITSDADNDECLVESIFHTISLPVTDDAAVLKKLDLPKMFQFCGSCNGLVLWMDLGNVDNLYLLNPVTKEQVTIPKCPFDSESSYLPPVHGFGYDSLSDDYKIVRIWMCYGTDVFLYSSKRGIWVRNSNFPQLSNCTSDFGVLVNGALHWTAYDIESRPVILAFDLATEEFNVIPTPPYADAELPKYHYTFTLGGCLCNAEFAQSEKDVIQGWIMKEYGSRESWTNFTLAVDLVGLAPISPLCYVGEDDVLLINATNRQLILYNLKEHTKKQMLVDTVWMLLTMEFCLWTALFRPTGLSFLAEADVRWRGVHIKRAVVG